VKFDFKGWSKVSATKDHTTMRSKDGHTVRIAHRALSPAMRKQLERIELPTHMNKGGMVEDKGPKIDPKKAAEMQKGATQSGWQPKRWADNLKSGLGMAEGGQVPKKGAEAPTDRQPTKEDVELVDQIKSPDLARMVMKESHGMAEGGEVEGKPIVLNINTSPQPMAPVPAGLEQVRQEAPGAVRQLSPEQLAASTHEQLPYGVTPDMVQQSPQLREPAASPQVGAPAAMPAQQPQAVASSAAPQELAKNPESLALQGVGLQMQGLQDEAKAAAMQGAQEAGYAQEAMVLQKQRAEDYQKRIQALDSRRDKIMADYQSGKIDPEKFWNEKSAVGKAAAIVGLIVGGMGAGMQGGKENAALAILNKQIENDINAQKANLGKQENLLSALQKEYGNLNDAENMARVMQQDFMASQLKLAAAKAKDPMAQARLLQASGELIQKSAPMVAKMAARQTLNELQKSGMGNDPTKAGQMIAAMREIDPEMAKSMQQRFIPGLGIASTDKGAERLREVKVATDNVRDGVNQLLEIAGKPGKALSLDERAKAQTIATMLVGSLNKTITGGGPMSEGERKLVESIVADPTRLFTLDSSNRTRLKTLIKRTQDGLNNEARVHGITPPAPEANLPPEQRKFVEWARQNPQDPRSKMVLEKLGIE
jgi:hypothetical protein